MLYMIMQNGDLDLTMLLIIGVLAVFGFIMGLVPILGAVYSVLIAIAFIITGGNEIGIIIIAGAVWIGSFLGAIVTFVLGGPLWYSPNLLVSTILILIYMFILLLTVFGSSVESLLIGGAVSGGMGAGLAFAALKAPDINKRLGCRCVTVKGKKICAGNLESCEA